MRQYDPARVTVAFAKLFQTYPSFQAATEDEADETLRVYFEAVEPYETGDIERAVENFLTGNAPGHNAAFAPPAPFVAAECRRVMNLRLNHERLTRKPLPPPADPEITPEERERGKSILAKLAKSIPVTDEEIERARASKERGEKELHWLKGRGDLVEVRGTSVPVSQSLLRQFEVGDPEGEAETGWNAA